MENNSYLGQINSSGFPFQIRVEQEIKKSFIIHKWSSIGLEHRWINKDSGSEGFIDIVLEKKMMIFFLITLSLNVNALVVETGFFLIMNK